VRLWLRLQLQHLLPAAVAAALAAAGAQLVHHHDLLLPTQPQACPPAAAPAVADAAAGAAVLQMLLVHFHFGSLLLLLHVPHPAAAAAAWAQLVQGKPGLTQRQAPPPHVAVAAESSMLFAPHQHSPLLLPQRETHPLAAASAASWRTTAGGLDALLVH
jgi:hypothetical protein